MSSIASMKAGIADSARGGATAPSTPRSLPDGALLGRFLDGRDGEAFGELVCRHGPKVMRVCLRWLGDRQEAEDACQATFLVLVARAGEIREVDRLDGW